MTYSTKKQLRNRISELEKELQLETAHLNNARQTRDHDRAQIVADRQFIRNLFELVPALAPLTKQRTVPLTVMGWVDQSRRYDHVGEIILNAEHDHEVGVRHDTIIDRELVEKLIERRDAAAERAQAQEVAEAEEARLDAVEAKLSPKPDTTFAPLLTLSPQRFEIKGMTSDMFSILTGAKPEPTPEEKLLDLLVELGHAVSDLSDEIEELA